MTEKSQPNQIFYGRPADKSFEAFKEFIRAMSENLGIPKERQSTDEKLRAAWKEFWAEADNKSKK